MAKDTKVIADEDRLLEELEKELAGLDGETRKKISKLKEDKLTRRKTLIRAVAAKNKEAAWKRRKIDNHAKYVLGVAAIDFSRNAQAGITLRQHLQNFYEKSPNNLETAEYALTLKVLKHDPLENVDSEQIEAIETTLVVEGA